MDKFTLPPTPNWHLSNILCCNDNGLLAYGSRCEVAIVDLKEKGKFNVSFINLAHKEKVNTVVFSPSNGNFKNCLATCADDGLVRVWDFKESRLLYCHSGHKDGLRVTGLDWSKADTNKIVSVNDLGVVVCWDLASNTIRRLHCGIKVLPLCLACCPHDKDLVAIGCKNGVTLVVDTKGNGKIVHRLRGHEQDVISVSWCPVPYNVIRHKRSLDPRAGGDAGSEGDRARDLLLATGGADKSIFIWRTGSDGRYEVVLNLPNISVGNSNPRKKGANNNTLVWTCVVWADPYTLLSTSQFGELLAWDLNRVHPNTDKTNQKKPQPRLLHSKHYKGCFSIACPVTTQTVDRGDERVVWTTAMDKHVVGCKLSSGSVVLDIPTLGGAVFSMALSPLDPNRLAIGSSDSKVFIWNLADLGALNISCYWKKIIGKVMALSWHPREESTLAYGTGDGHVGLIDVGSQKLPTLLGLHHRKQLSWHPREESTLAYGTGDGHVGLIDVGSQKLPTLLRLHHRKQVYRLCWAPPLLPPGLDQGDKLVLYSVGDGDILQYTADAADPNKEPLSLNTATLNAIDQSLNLQKNLIRSDIVFKPDNSCFAVGNENGSVYIISCQTLRLQHVVYPHKKLMNNLEWHPETVASDNNISPNRHWLATTCDNIKVYNIPPDGQAELVATLAGHSEKIVGLAWSPHYNGRLLSASYDYSVQIWDVASQHCLGVYMEHSMAVMCGVFSPLDPDVVISGSSDNTVRLWRISQLCAATARPEKKKGHVEKMLKKQKGEAQEATELTVGMSEVSSNSEMPSKHTTSSNSSLNSSSQSPPPTSSKGTEDYKKRQKSRAVFGVTGPKLTQARHFDVLYQRWASPTPAASAEPEENLSVEELGYLDFFGDDKAMLRLLMVEENNLIQQKQHQQAQQSMLWRGDVTSLLTQAITKKQLSDWLVALAPGAGFDMWEAACEAYSAQLVECGEIVKASSYLLFINKVHEAVRLLADYKQYREAVAVAKCRLPADDELTAQVYTEWGNTCRHQGSLQLAAHCFLAAGDTQACIETLARIKDLKSLKMAATLASRQGLAELACSLATECLTMAVTVGNLSVGHQMVQEMPQYQFWRVWLAAGEVVARVKNRSDAEVLGWLAGWQSAPVSLWDHLTASCADLQPTDSCYSKLLPHLPTNRTPEFERDVWLVVSGQLAAAWAARLESQTLRHLVSALSAAHHYQAGHPTSSVLLLTAAVLAPHGLFGKESFLIRECKAVEEKQLMKSLKAFVCAAVVHWLSNNWSKVSSLKFKALEGNTKEVEFKVDWLVELLTKCSAEVLDEENIAFFVKKAQKDELLNLVTQENIKKSAERKNEASSKDKSDQAQSMVGSVESKDNQKAGENFDLPTEIKEDRQITEHHKEENENCSEQPSKGLAVGKVELSVLDCSQTGSNGNIEISKGETNGNISESKSSLEGKSSEANDKTNGSLSNQGSNGDLVMKTTDSFKTNGEGSSSKLNEIKKLEGVLSEFESVRVAVPSPFTAYINIKYVIDQVIGTKDPKVAQQLQENCDNLWKKGQH